MRETIAHLLRCRTNAIFDALDRFIPVPSHLTSLLPLSGASVATPYTKCAQHTRADSRVTLGWLSRYTPIERPSLFGAVGNLKEGLTECAVGNLKGAIRNMKAHLPPEAGGTPERINRLNELITLLGGTPDV